MKHLKYFESIRNANVKISPKGKEFLKNRDNDKRIWTKKSVVILLNEAYKSFERGDDLDIFLKKYNLK